jgi:hypothetical protein
VIFSSEDVLRGGEYSLINMWYALVKFEDNQTITNQFKQAVYNVMVTYCEPRRLETLKREVDERITNNTPPAKLSNDHRKKIHYYGKFSEEVMSACVKGTIALNQRLPQRYMDVHGFDTMCMGDTWHQWQQWGASSGQNR